MTVTRIEELSRSRCKIYLEDSFALLFSRSFCRPSFFPLLFLRPPMLPPGIWKTVTSS